MKVSEINNIDDVKVVTQYIPIADKMHECQRILDATYYITQAASDKKDTEKVFRQNTVAKNILFSMVAIAKYTNLEVDWGEFFKDYDTLKENGAYEDILKLLPEDDFVDFASILDDMAIDLVQNERSLASYFDNKLGTLSAVLEAQQ